MTSNLNQSDSGLPRCVITFGTFDLFHIGHLNIIRRARDLGDRLVVGVSTDELNFRKKGIYPVFPEAERFAIVAGLRYVDEVFAEESLDLKAHYIRTHGAQVLVMGDDWAGRFDQFRELCEVVYLPRTEGVSTTEIKGGIAAGAGLRP
ncbi:adenylyltransferase/cytidyltransferase family protein [Roseomonas marmotae]|uniref:Adenylyltransferase/cytidyltransferase family protein n=1 Tax=Roseomonas marmotae TaxID=2768161 RepID=A0ABS3KGJ7_9PROT|nr:adenylyltransferase/cytidyltransferase family protein [Roseomonas marmotae]MBO1076598.1 adenylyltransferase/cytidyltransferase family protein [Roseomonas marmotae]QTI79582.1 adenylyltransferase/cytidyltransferase family protein [Roseomonas marmotae]